MDNFVKEVDRRNINLKMYEIFNKKLDDYQNRQQSFLLTILAGFGIIFGFFIQYFNQITTLTNNIGSSYIIYILILAGVIIFLFIIYFIIRFKYYKDNIEVINGHLVQLEKGGGLLCVDECDINRWEKNFEKQMHLREKKTLDYSFLIASICSLFIIGIIIFSISRLSNSDLQKAIKENKTKSTQINELETKLKELDKKYRSLLLSNPSPTPPTPPTPPSPHVTPITPINPISPIKP